MYHAALERPATLPGAALTFRSPAFEPAQYIVTCIPARDGGGTVENWTLRQLGDDAFHVRLRGALPEGTCYAPTVSAMSGAVLSHESFTVIYDLDGSRRILRPGAAKKADVRVPCDGTFIEPKEGFVMTAGGCPLLVLSGSGEYGRRICIVAHAGRDSLVDPLMIRKNQPSRVYGSVVMAMMMYAYKHFRADPKDLVLRSFFSLPWQSFPHDMHDLEHRAANRKLHEYLQRRGLEDALLENGEGLTCLSLNVLVQLQARQLGIGHIESGLHDLPENGDFAYTRHALPELRGAMRNLVILRRFS